MTLIENITEQLATYNAMEISADNLQYLMGIRKSLSYNAYLLGLDVARSKRKLESVKAQRKIQFFKSKKLHLDEGVGKAEVFAEVKISELREEEANYDGLYYGYKIILEQSNACLSSMVQDISQLRLEYKSEA